MALKPPVEVPQGAIRLNTDSQKLEFFAQDQWWEMATEESMTTSERGISAGGAVPGSTPASPVPASVARMEYFHMRSSGNAADFGDLTVARYCREGGGGSNTRGIFGQGYFYTTPSPDAYHNVIDYITIASQGNASDFGDMLVTTMHGGNLSNSTRMLLASGHTTSNPYPLSNHINYVTISTTGNALDFGDLTTPKWMMATASSRTRGLWAGGSPTKSPAADSNTIQYVTIASTGNSIDFGDLNTALQWAQGAHNNVRAVWMGGYVAPGTSNVIQMTTIASTGNAKDFGDLSQAGHNAGVCSSPIEGFMMGGEPGRLTHIQKVSLNGTSAKAMEFGDLTTGIAYNAGVSNCHGGL